MALCEMFAAAQLLKSGLYTLRHRGIERALLNDAFDLIFNKETICLILFFEKLCISRYDVYCMYKYTHRCGKYVSLHRQRGTNYDVNRANVTRLFTDSYNFTASSRVVEDIGCTLCLKSLHK